MGDLPDDHLRGPAGALLADVLAGIPTLIESYRHPESESWIAYTISAVGFGISLLSVQTYDFENTAFVAYIFVMNSAFAVLASRGRQHVGH